VIDPLAELNRELKALGVGLEVVGHLVLAGEGPRRSRERHARQSVISRGAVELQGVPLLTPPVPDAFHGVDDQHGAPTSSEQIARATAALLDAGSDRSGIYHATASGATTWFGFAGAIFEARRRALGDAFRIPSLVPIATADYPTPARRPRNSVLSNAKLENVFGVRLGDWREGLEEAIAALPA